MYLTAVLAFMLVLPVVSIVAELYVRPGTDLVFLVGRWFVFWGVGMRLFTAGIRQVLGPQFTAQEILGISDPAALTVVRELGYGNLAIGLIGLLSIFNAAWIVPAAIVGGLFYGLAGITHIFAAERNANETIAMVSDLFVFIVLAGFLLAALVRPRGLF